MDLNVITQAVVQERLVNEPILLMLTADVLCKKEDATAGILDLDHNEYGPDQMYLVAVAFAVGSLLEW